MGSLAIGSKQLALHTPQMRRCIVKLSIAAGGMPSLALHFFRRAITAQRLGKRASFEHLE